MSGAKTKGGIERIERFLSAADVEPADVKQALGVLQDLAAVFFQERAEIQAPKPHTDSSVDTIPKPASNNFETMYRILAEQIPAVVFLAYLDEGFGEAYVSPHIETVLGFSQEEWLNDPVRWFKQLHPEDKQRWSMEAAQMFLSGAPLQSTYRVLARDGHWVWFQCDARMIRHDDGRPWLVHGVAFDVTELKESQEALSRDIAERQRLEQQLLQAQKMESIGALAGGVAHDFNNILNIILGYSSLLMTNLEDPPKVRQALEVISETAQRGAALVQQLLTVARKAPIKFVSTDIDEFLQHFANLLRETFPKDMNIAVELNPGVSRIMADPNRLLQALLNLCVNARDAMNGRGNLVLRVEIAAGRELRRRFREASEERYVCIAVRDTGPGMDAITRGRIFDPFFTTKEPGRGTGLGLPAVYAIVRDHNGFIDVESEPGRGTTFRTYLPARLSGNVEITASPIARANNDLPEFREVILFVDDEVHQLNLMSRFLERKGFRVLTARDGIEAVEIHSRHKDEIAVVIMDMALPKLSGTDAFLTLKEARQDVKTIFATGYITPEERLKLIGQGAVDILEKPYLPEELLQEIRTALGKTAQPQQT